MTRIFYQELERARFCDLHSLNLTAPSTSISLRYQCTVALTTLPFTSFIFVGPVSNHERGDVICLQSIFTVASHCSIYSVSFFLESDMQNLPEASTGMQHRNAALQICCMQHRYAALHVFYKFTHFVTENFQF
jgi:hypothetical protein